MKTSLVSCVTLYIALAGLLPTASVVAESPAERARAMINAEIVFQPSVFWEEEFPQADFVDPGSAERWLGDYKIDVTYYDRDYQVVTVPRGTGRYGAVVKITAEDGQEYTRYRTLYKSPQEVSFFFNRLRGDLSLPSSTGIEPRTWTVQQSILNSYVGRALGRDMNRSHDLAILFSCLDEIGPDALPVTKYNGPLSQDRKWWLKLKRKLNGNADRFTAAVPVPSSEEGLNARVLRKGNPEEAGMQPDAVDKIDAVLCAWAADSDQPFNVCVARHGVLFFDRAYGERDGEPITTDTRHIVFSISKALSGSLLMSFVHRGVVKLDDPVEKYLPEFNADHISTPATLHHLFTHTADMDGHFTDFQSDLEHVYGEAYPHLAIGKQHRYNGTSIGIGLKVLEQITGMTLPDLYQAYLFGPLGCQSIESIDGSAMTWSNAYDLALVGQMLANHGAYGQKRFFSEAVFESMLPRRLDSLLGAATDVTWGIGLTWFSGDGLSDRTIGHGSASSCTLLVDLENDLVITMTRQTAGRNFRKYHPQFIRAVTSSIAP